jgi:hypothetical protein
MGMALVPILATVLWLMSVGDASKARRRLLHYLSLALMAVAVGAMLMEVGNG